MESTSRGNGAEGAPRVGLALAGGGPGGAVYEIGALRALEESLEGLAFDDLDIYVGVSAGAFVASCLANGVTISDLCRAIVDDSADSPFAPGRFLTPALGEMARRAASAPGLFLQGAWDLARNPGNFSLLEPVLRLSRALPAGLFESEPIRRYLQRILSRRGRTDDFRQLGKRLVVVAVDIDSGKAIRFGDPGFDDVPISLAVQASSALPGLFMPVEIAGRCYVDGVLLKTLHASVAVEEGADLVLAINPIVPADTARAVEEGVLRRGRLVDRGLPVVLSQTFRTMIHSRLERGVKAYEVQYPGTDIVLVEPRRDDYRMFFTNIFSFSERRAVCDHAYRRTREFLWKNREVLGEKFARHGLHLKVETLIGRDRDLWSGLDPVPPRRSRHEPLSAITDRLALALDRLDQLLPDVH